MKDDRSVDVESARRRVLLAAGGLVAAGVASPLWMRAAHAQQAPIKIGFPVPVTGAYSAEAQDRCAPRNSPSRSSTTPAA